MDAATLNAYETRAAEFAARYGAADLTPLHRLLLAHLPSGCRVLEVGCGTGREAAFLAGHGFRVVATDASAAMLAQAERHPDVTCIAYSDPRVCYGSFMHLLRAAFPLPSGHPLLADRFDAVLALAVVMHLPDADLFEFAFQIRSLLNPGGTVVLSLSEGRALGADSRAPDGRLFRERPPGEAALLFERLGFRILAREESADTLGRDAIRWTTLVLRLDAASGSRPVDQIETIINHDKKDATYKLALLRALCDIAQTASRHVRWHPDGTVSVPLGLVTEKWLYYYWPLIDTGDEPIIPQKRGMEVNTPIAFRHSLAALAAHYRGQNGLSRFHGEFQGGRLDPVARALADAALNRIANTIVVGPVTFASQGGFRFDSGRRMARNRCHTPQSLYESLGRIHFDAGVWRELCLVGHWIGEAIILRWAELTVEISRRQVPLTRVIEKLLTRPETERDVAAARDIYKSAAGLSCVWTRVALDDRRFEVDHAIPFAIWHNNDLWNLLPADARVNNAKRDRLVSRATLDRSRDAIITAWQTTRAAMPERFDLELSRTLFGRNHADAQWEAPAFAALVEAVETLAIQRGVERWEPARPLAATVQAAAASACRSDTRTEMQDGGDSRYPSPTTAPVPELDRRRPITHYHALPQGRTLIDPDEVPRLAFKSALPIVADLAAGPFFDGFETGHLHDLNDLDWIAVSPALCKPNRFVIRVAGDSMEPLFSLGDLLIFEYHRTPRQDNQIVIAADFTGGAANGAYGVKRYRAHPNAWIFASENPSYEPVRIPKAEMAYPILGVYVERVADVGVESVC